MLKLVITVNSVTPEAASQFTVEAAARVVQCRGGPGTAAGSSVFRVTLPASHPCLPGAAASSARYSKKQQAMTITVHVQQ